MDVYCERVGPGLLAEPLNAVSNVSFLLAAWAAWVLAKRTGALSAGVRALIVLAASVGIGSILWHTYPTSLTLILDIVPILIFLIWYIWLYTRNVIGMRSLFAVASVAAFLLATFLAIPYSDVLHGATRQNEWLPASPCLQPQVFIWQLSSSARLIMRSVLSYRSVLISSGTF
jgi:hypothetical protein